MKRKTSSTLLIVLILNMIGIFATLLPTTTVIVAEATTSSLPIIDERFDSYSDISGVTTAGWSVGASTVLSSDANGGKCLQNANGETSVKTFTPILIRNTASPTPVGAITPGNNAKIVLEFDAYVEGAATNVPTYFKLDGGTNTAFSAGQIYSRNKFEYTNSIDATSGRNKYNISDTITRYMHFKVEIKVTKSDGTFYSTNTSTSPNVFVWCNGQLYLAGIYQISTSCNYVDRFSFGGGATGILAELDNLSINLVTSDTVPANYTVAPTVDPGGLATGSIFLPSYAPKGVDSGDGKTIELAPASGKYVEYLKVNDKYVGYSKIIKRYSGTTAYYYYTIPEITKDTTVYTRFTSTAPTFDMTALQGNIDRAVALYATASTNIGTGVGQYLQTNVTNLYSALTSAQALAASEPYQFQIDAEATNLQNARWACTPIADPTITNRPIWQEDFSDTVKYPNVYSAYPADNSSLNELLAAGWTMTAKATSSPKPYVCDATERYLRVSEGGGAFHSIDFTLPETVRISDGVVSGTDPGHPGNNAKLTFEYKAKVNARNSQYASAQLSLNSLQGQKVVGLNASNGSPNAMVKSYWPAPTPAITAYTLSSTWVKYKHVLNITDVNGAYVKTADLYVDRGYGYDLEYSNVPYDSNALTVGKFAVGTKDSYNTNGWWVDDIKVTLSKVDEAVTTPSPTPSPPPTPTPSTYNVSVSINGDGSGNYYGMVIDKATEGAVANGQSITVNAGGTIDFKIVSYCGKKIGSVVYDGVTLGGSNQFTYSFTTSTVTGNKSLVVNFTEYSPTNPEVSTYDKVFKSVESSSPVAVSYGTVHGNGYTSYGIILWSTVDADLTLADVLANPGNGKYVFTAATGRGSSQAAGKNDLGQFGVGLRSLPIGSYKMKTYVSFGSGQVNYGDIITFSVS